MAISLNTLRSQKQTSIHGRRLALTQDDYLVGPKGYKEPVFELTSASTAQTLAGYGLTMINVTSAVTTGTNTFTLPSPVPGSRMRVGQGVRGTTSTQGSTAIEIAQSSGSVYFKSSEGTTMVAALLPFGTVITLEALTTDCWQVTGRSGLLSLVGAT